MPTYQTTYSFAVFPFLKTSRALSIGHLTFRSTDATDALSPEQVVYVQEIAGMLFLQDDLRIKSASYAVVPLVDMNAPITNVEHLTNVQSVVAYRYAQPRHEFADLFLSPEHCSMAVFTPARLFASGVRPDFHVHAADPKCALVADDRGQVGGYAGLYNFRHYFWVARGSRVYGPKPHLTLNQSQDLSRDLHDAMAPRADFRLLSELLRKPDTQTSSRIFTAVRWFNAANNEANDDAAALVNLSIAFEALLSLPPADKTDRLTDAISLLLGRLPRLGSWARQFYDARSQIVHEGRAQQLRFVATDSRKATEGPLYQSLLSYGRQIFQLCLGTLLVGAELAESAGLEEKLVTNQERFQRICRVLEDKTVPARERLEHIGPIVAAIKQYRFVSESALQLETMIGATRLAAKTLLERDAVISPEVKEHLERLIASTGDSDHYQELDALRALESIHIDAAGPTETACFESVRALVEVVWSYVGMHYFWLKEQHPDEPQSPKGQAEESA